MSRYAVVSCEALAAGVVAALVRWSAVDWRADVLVRWSVDWRVSALVRWSAVDRQGAALARWGAVDWRAAALVRWGAVDWHGDSFDGDDGGTCCRCCLAAAAASMTFTLSPSCAAAQYGHCYHTEKYKQSNRSADPRLVCTS